MVPVVVIGTSSPALSDRQVTAEEASDFANRLNAGYYEVELQASSGVLPAMLLSLLGRLEAREPKKQEKRSAFSSLLKKLTGRKSGTSKRNAFKTSSSLSIEIVASL